MHRWRKFSFPFSSHGLGKVTKKNTFSNFHRAPRKKLQIVLAVKRSESFTFVYFPNQKAMGKCENENFSCDVCDGRNFSRAFFPHFYAPGDDKWKIFQQEKLLKLPFYFQLDGKISHFRAK
jgi:hypothetical protein